MDKLYTERQLKRIFLHVALALKHLHENNRVHNDVKPANILIGDVVKDGQEIYMLADFGIGVKVVAPSGSPQNSKEDLTTAEAAALMEWHPGTPYYMPPEYLVEKGGELVRADRIEFHQEGDIYALGITMMQLAAPYIWKDDSDKRPAAVALNRRKNGSNGNFSASELRSLAHDVHGKHLYSRSFFRLVARCLRFAPSKRITAATVVSRLSPRTVSVYFMYAFAVFLVGSATYLSMIPSEKIRKLAYDCTDKPLRECLENTIRDFNYEALDAMGKDEVDRELLIGNVSSLKKNDSAHFYPVSLAYLDAIQLYFCQRRADSAIFVMDDAISKLDQYELLDQFVLDKGFKLRGKIESFRQGLLEK